MSQNGEEPKYTLVKSDGTVEHTSRHYDGSGVATYENKDSYEGDFVKGLRTGRGIYRFQDEAGGAVGSKYDGEWKDNKMHGMGVYRWIDGRMYEGSYVHDKKHGYGVYRWADGRKYEGKWENGKQHGRGKYLLLNGEVKVGDWVNGKRIRWIESAPGATSPSPAPVPHKLSHEMESAPVYQD